MSNNFGTKYGLDCYTDRHKLSTYTIRYAQ